MIDAAKAVRVSRATLYRWQKNDARFIVALNLWRNQNRLQLDAGISALAGKALAVITSAIDRGNLHAAITVFKHICDQEIGSGNAKLVAEELQYRRKRVTARVYKMRALPEPQTKPAEATDSPEVKTLVAAAEKAKPAIQWRRSCERLSPKEPRKNRVKANSGHSVIHEVHESPRREKANAIFRSVCIRALRESAALCRALASSGP